MTKSDDELLTSTQAGLILGVSAKTVTRRALNGEIPISQQLPGPNGAYLFRRSDVLALLTDQAKSAS